MNETVTRRQALRIAIGTGGLAVAGCLGDDADEPAPTPTDEPGSAGNETDGDDHDETERPTTGEAVPGLASLDETMLEYMDSLDIDAGALGVARDGEVVFERGYGWADRDRTEPLPADAVFRIGSISKGFTDAAVRHLFDTGGLDPDDRVYPLLDVEPPGGEPADERVREVRVQHLLDHEGGWDAAQAGDPMYQPLAVKASLGLDGLPDKYDVTRYVLDRPMQFDPGDRQAYSNFGYCLLGQVIEAVSGTDYQSYLEGEIFGPAGVEGIEVGRTRPEDRHSDEVWYDDPERCQNAFDTDEEGPCADVGFLMEPFDAAGGHVCSTRPLLRFLDAFWLTGDPRTGTGTGTGTGGQALLFGSHPGSFALARQYPDGTDAVALFNRRALPLSRSQVIDGMLDEALDEVEWP